MKPSHEYVIYGAHANYCGFCRAPVDACTCERAFSARRAVVAGVNGRPSLRIFWSAEDGGYIATCDIPGISAFGDTPTEALHELLIVYPAARECYAAAKVQITTSTGGETAYITAAPPAPGPVSVPSVFGTSPLTHQATCPTCGQPLPGGTPAKDAPKDVSADRGVAPTKDANVAGEDKPSGWRDRPPLS